MLTRQKCKHVVHILAAADARLIGQDGQLRRVREAGADLQLLLSHEGKPDEGQQLLHLIKIPVRLPPPRHARCEEACLRACLQRITFLLS